MTRDSIGLGAEANDGTGDPLRTAFGKVNDNAAKDAALQTASGLPDGATNLASVPVTTASTASPQALTNSDSIKGGILKLAGRSATAGPKHGIDANRTGRELGDDYDYITDDSGVEGTTNITGLNATVSDYPDGTGIYHLVTQRSGGAGGSAGRLYIVEASKGGSAWRRQRTEGVWGAWDQTFPLADAALVTQNDTNRTALPAGSDWRENVATGRYYGAFTSASPGYSDFPITWTGSKDWQFDVTRLDGTTGEIVARAFVARPNGEPIREYTWRMDVSLTLDTDTSWVLGDWVLDKHEEPWNEDNENPRSWAPYEAWLKIGQSNAVGTTHVKDASYPGSQPALDLYGEDAPMAGCFETSRTTAYSPYVKGPQYSKHLLRNRSEDKDLVSTLGISLANTFTKERRRMFPGIKEITVVQRAKGGQAMSDGWNPPSGGFYLNAVGEMLAFLARNPHYRFAGILWHQGESDAIDGRTQAQYEADVAAMVTNLRADIPGGTNVPFIAGTMSITWREYDNVATTPADKDEIHRAQIRTPEYVPNSACVLLDDLVEDDNGDRIHFGRGHLRIMGRRYAHAAAPLVNFEPQLPRYRLRYDPYSRRYKNTVEECGEVYDERLVDDPDRGLVLTTEDSPGAGTYTGFYTDLVVSYVQYTKACWVRSKAASQAPIAGLIMGGNNGVAHLMQCSRVGHGDFAANVGNVAFNALPNDVWTHVAVTYDRTNIRAYVNGALVSGFPVAMGALTGQGSAEIGEWQGTTPFEGLFDDIVVLPYALSQSGVQALMDLP